MNAKSFRLRLVPVAAALGACWSFGASAATTVYCPGTLPATPSAREFSVTPNSDGAGKPVCYLFGDGNGAAGNPSDVILAANPTYLFLDKTGDVGGLANGALVAVQDSTSASPAPGNVKGRFWVDATKLVGFENFIVAFTTGQPPGITPDYASYKFFNITECTAANPCDWMTEPDNSGSLSHATLYGTRSDGSQVVPIPAAAWLMGSGILGLLALGRRRKASAAIVA
jgi:hypothetical protein